MHLFWPRKGKRSIERFLSRVQRLCKFFGTKGIFYTRKNVQLLQDWFGIPDVTSRENVLYRSRGTCCVRGIFDAGNFKFSLRIGCLMAGIRNARKTPPLVLIVAYFKVLTFPWLVSYVSLKKAGTRSFNPPDVKRLIP